MVKTSYVDEEECETVTREECSPVTREECHEVVDQVPRQSSKEVSSLYIIYIVCAYFIILMPRFATLIMWKTANQSQKIFPRKYQRSSVLLSMK